MSATDKNAQALKALFGDAALTSRLGSTRIAVVTPSEDMPKSGLLLAEVLADVLGRLWPNIDFKGSCAELQLSVAVNAAKSGSAPVDGLSVQWAPPYDCMISIGSSAIPDRGYVIQVGANNWDVQLGPEAVCGPSDNPVGPAFAAALAAAQVFYHMFESELGNMNVVPLDSCQVDLKQLFHAAELEVGPLNIGETHVFGVGAVTHGLVWLLEHWPSAVTGEINLVDQDNYGDSNGQRYAFMRAENWEQAKVSAVKRRLDAAHPHLLVQEHPVDLNSYCAERGYESPLQRAIAGLDSAEARRHVALKLPERTVNMWTEGVRIGAGRYLPGDGNACLACGYLENADTPVDEVGEIYQQTGIRPDLIRSLLDSGRGLTHQESTMVAGHRGVKPDQFVGQPLRSVLPALCATGRLQMPKDSEAVDVPFAFASLFAGIAGFVMLLKDCCNNLNGSYGWTQHIFKQPSAHMYSSLYTKSNCVCCSAMEQTGWSLN